MVMRRKRRIEERTPILRQFSTNPQDSALPSAYRASTREARDEPGNFHTGKGHVAVHDGDRGFDPACGKSRDDHRGFPRAEDVRRRAVLTAGSHLLGELR